MGKLIVSLSPHAHGNESVEKNMYGVIIALVPAILASIYFFGLGSVVVLLTYTDGKQGTDNNDPKRKVTWQVHAEQKTGDNSRTIKQTGLLL